MKITKKIFLILIIILWNSNLFAFIPNINWLLKKMILENKKSFLKTFSINVTCTNFILNDSLLEKVKNFFIIKFKAPNSLIFNKTSYVKSDNVIRILKIEKFHFPVLLKSFLIDLQNNIIKDDIAHDVKELINSNNIDFIWILDGIDEEKLINSKLKTFFLKSIIKSHIDIKIISLSNLGDEKISYLLGSKSCIIVNNAIWIDKKTFLFAKISEHVVFNDKKMLVETYFHNWTNLEKIKYPRMIEVYHNNVLARRFVLSNLKL